MSPFESLVDTSVDAAEVAWLVSKRAAAIRSRDAEYLASRYAPAALTFGVAPPLAALQGEAGGVDRLRRWFDAFDGRIRYSVRGLTVSIGGDLAFCHSVDLFSARHLGRRRREVQLATTLCMERAGGVWLITAERLQVVE
jgi:ketosteroid isomerase-like protein